MSSAKAPLTVSNVAGGDEEVAAADDVTAAVAAVGADGGCFFGRVHSLERCKVLPQLKQRFSEGVNLAWWCWHVAPFEHPVSE